ncbi:MAG: hypothetical protein KGH49_02315 [Candidatus Micrarchaeota archaeon]|nr:hypothetical protein [Candidatus Micrarchaeota archaeon]
MIPKIGNITKDLERLQARQDRVMSLSRSVIRLAGESISNMHAKKYREVKKQLARLKKMVLELKGAEGGFEYYSMQAHQEYVEASMLYSIITTGKVPGASEMKENSVNYLLGVMDTMGELKRESFEEMRAGNIRRAKEYFTIMQKVYDATLHIRFANSVLPNFRKKQDVARIQLEGTGSELLRLSGSDKV